MDHKTAIDLVCCCEDVPPGCGHSCVYIAIDNLGTLEWEFVPNAPDPECEDDCGCLEPDIEPECEGQVARCVCALRDSSGTPIDNGPSAPNCAYEACGSTEE